MRDHKERLDRLMDILNDTATGRVLDHGTNPVYRGILDCTDGYAKLTGPCGDTDEIFLRIHEGRVKEVRFTTDGCLFTTAACDALARLTAEKSLEECRLIDQQMILDYLETMPEDHYHCALLAVLTLREAINQYLFSGGTW